MKKIGVITFNKSLNYGAYLQAFALQKALGNLGANASLIDYENPVDKKRYKLIHTHSTRSFLSSVISLPIMSIRKLNFLLSQKKFKYSPINDKYDIAITGSDQVWNPKLLGGSLDEKFFLRGITANKKISYAPSISREDVIDEYGDEYKELLKELDHISVREETAKKKLSKYTSKNIFVAVDPVFLLTKKEWDDVIKDKKHTTKPYIFTYFVNGIKKEENALLTKVSNKLGLKCVTYSKKPIEKNKLKYSFTDGPLDFLAKLRDAKIVITSSFHGIAFSIIFNKNFYYFLPRNNNRSRIDNILHLLGLEDRIIESESDLDKINLNNISYGEPRKKLKELQRKSLDWLKNAIED